VEALATMLSLLMAVELIHSANHRCALDLLATSRQPQPVPKHFGSAMAPRFEVNRSSDAAGG